jgi:AmmeMemoRadiSam system protein A
MTPSSPVVLAGLSPHPPVAVPDVGHADAARVSKTAAAMTRLGQAIAARIPDTLVLIGPHGPVFRDAIAINGQQTIKGDLGSFGAPSNRISFENDLELAHEIQVESRKAGIPCIIMGERENRQYGVAKSLDHGAVVPLLFFSGAGVRCRLVNITMGFLPYLKIYEFGMALARAAEAMGRKIAVVASGDLSHRLTSDAPAGYNPRGAEFDELLTRAVRDCDPELLAKIDDELVEAAGECGLRPVIMMFGALDGQRISGNLLSYESPFGVGYGVAIIAPEGPDPDRRLIQKWNSERHVEMKRVREAESHHVRLARYALETFIRNGKRVGSQHQEDLLLSMRAGCFCTLKKFGQLRGCIGTTGPTTPDLASEIIQNVISAGSEDPRFEPVGADELEDLVYSVDVLSTPALVDGPEDLDAKTYGVIVEKGNRRGLLLPDLEGIDSVSKQIEIAKQKAGIGLLEDVRLYRFTVTRYH